MKKSVKFIIIGLIALAVTKSDSWGSHAGYIIMKYVYEFEVNKLYESYMKTHPEPCDNLFIAHEASVKAYRENYSNFIYRKSDDYTGKRYSYYIEVNNLTEENKPWFVWRKIFAGKFYLSLDDCRYQFINYWNDSQSDDLRVGVYEIHVKYNEKKWDVEYFRNISYEQAISKAKQWHEAP